VSETDLRRALQGTAAPDELGAERRAWAVLRSAYAETEPPASRRRPARLVLALAAALALVAAALSPPGRAVGGWVREAVGIERVGGREDARPALASLPANGSLLVVARTGAWVVRDDGSKRRLGAYRDATWSPHGLHVAATRGRRLVALTPEGDVRWTRTKARPVHHPAWSPSGFRIAYGAGGDLRVVNGDGEPDRLLARRVRRGSWAWRPDRDRHVLAYVTRAGAVTMEDTDTRQVLWRWRGAVEPLERLAWSADGRRLVAAAPHAITVFGPRGRLLASVPPAPPEATRSIDVAFAPTGRSFAVVSRDATGRSRVVLLVAERRTRPRALFSGDGRLSELAWSPDGRWLLVAWPSADQWLFLRLPGVRKIDAVSDIRREFDPGGTGAGAFPRLSGWCCPPETR
jgi:hypothetical protein